MIVSFIITLRETLEIALIIAIIFRYLRKSNQIEFTKYAIWGIITGLMLSIFGGLLIKFLSILFEGKTEQIFEGIIMLIGAILLTTMILWMINQKNISEELERKIQTEINKTHKFGIFFLIMTSILREGIEIVLFLSAARFSDESNSLLGATFGIIVAIILGIILYQGTSKINLKLFFNLTSIFLIIISAGLFSYSLHEFQEAGIIPIIIEHFYDINFIIDEKGIFGSFLKGLFGYNGNPSLLEMITYIFYILIVFTIWKFLKKEPNQNQKNILKKESNLLIN